MWREGERAAAGPDGEMQFGLDVEVDAIRCNLPYYHNGRFLGGFGKYGGTHEYPHVASVLGINILHLSSGWKDHRVDDALVLLFTADGECLAGSVQECLRRALTRTESLVVVMFYGNHYHVCVAGKRDGTCVVIDSSRYDSTWIQDVDTALGQQVRRRVDARNS